MADLSDPNIVQAYNEIEQHQETNWLLLGYHDTRDVISLYSKGAGGLSEFRNQLMDEVLYGFVRVEDRFVLITWISDQVSGVRRARALVHSRSVASLLKNHNAHMTASSINDLSDNNVRARLKLDIASKRLSKRQSQNEEFVEDEERQASLRRKHAEDEKRRAEMAAVAARERARLAAEEEARRKKQEAALLARAEAEAKAKRAREEEEMKRRQAQQALEEDRKKKAEAEKRRAHEEEIMKRKMREAEKNKDVSNLNIRTWGGLDLISLFSSARR
ncbi:hypothetical protein BX666DRAFT_898684 [Dichotomocladium elegans]|nr:hypothetical protein BX666DRAFT_898684 [Dichotomocladium elegans]